MGLSVLLTCSILFVVTACVAGVVIVLIKLMRITQEAFSAGQTEGGSTVGVEVEPVSDDGVEPSDQIYGGLVTATGKRAPTGPHLLVSGPTGSGKTRRVLAPAVVAWDGPAVVISSKPDLFELTSVRRMDRASGRSTYLLDLSGAFRDRELPEGVVPVVVDPTALIRDDDDAREMATVLSRSTSRTRGAGDGVFWEKLAMGPLAGLLRAAGADGVGWAVRAKDDFRSSSKVIEEWEAPPEKSLMETDQQFSLREDAWDQALSRELERPSWRVAVGRLRDMGSEFLGSILESAMEKVDGQRSSIQLYMDTGLDPWLKESSRPKDGDLLFSPTLLQDHAATLYVVSPMDGAGPAIAELCLDIIVQRWRENQTEEQRLPRLLVVADELCNTVPWSRLPVAVAEARGMGIAVLAAVQSTTQLARVFRTEGMLELRDIMPATLCLAGSGLSEGHLWSDALNLVQLAEATGSTPLAAPPCLPETIDQGAIFYKAFPPGVEEASAFGTGLSVRLADISEFTVKPVKRSSRGSWVDRYPDVGVFTDRGSDREPFVPVATEDVPNDCFDKEFAGEDPEVPEWDDDNIDVDLVMAGEYFINDTEDLKR